MFYGKNKAVTFSYDDGVTQDIRLVELFNKYGLKATFNINSELLGTDGELNVFGNKVTHNKVNKSDVAKIYDGHEIAVHTLTHPTLVYVKDDSEIIRQITEDQKNLSELAGYEVVGMAYPGGRPNYNSRIAQLIEDNTSIKYARTSIDSYDFALQRDLLEFHPTIHHTEWNKMFELAEKFISSESEYPQIFYIWGHSYEFDGDNSWDKMEEFCKLISGKDDIYYGTNKDTLLHCTL